MLLLDATRCKNFHKLSYTYGECFKYFLLFESFPISSSVIHRTFVLVILISTRPNTVAINSLLGGHSCIRKSFPSKSYSLRVQIIAVFFLKLNTREIFSKTAFTKINSREKNLGKLEFNTIFYPLEDKSFSTNEKECDLNIIITLCNTYSLFMLFVNANFSGIREN